jgi:hypothetical protein
MTSNATLRILWLAKICTPISDGRDGLAVAADPGLSVLQAPSTFRAVAFNSLD